jgi:hypothetical protein
MILIGIHNHIYRNYSWQLYRISSKIMSQHIDRHVDYKGNINAFNNVYKIQDFAISRAVK